jgi:hypothetical protein
VEDSAEIVAFENYVNTVLEKKRDTIIPDTIAAQYEVKYASHCHFSEILMAGGKAIYTTSGASFRPPHVHHDTVIEMVPIFENERIPYLCKERPSQPDSTYETTIGFEFTTINEAGVITGFIFGWNEFVVTSVPQISGHHGYSYDNSKYLILESSAIMSIGSQTSHGSTTTYYLERIEP